MPTVVFASSKGGAGKSTSAVILATELGAAGKRIAMIDADPNQHLARWARAGEKPAAVDVLAATQDNIIDLIDTHSGSADYVIVDVEGSANMAAAYAISRANLVVVPCQHSSLDAAEAMKTISLIDSQEKAFRLKINRAILWTMTSSVRSKTDVGLVQQLKDMGIVCFDTEIVKRDAFKQLFVHGGSLYDLDPSLFKSKNSAIKNSQSYTIEALRLLAKTPA